MFEFISSLRVTSTTLLMIIPSRRTMLTYLWLLKFSQEKPLEFKTIKFTIEDIVLRSTNSVKLLGFIIDCKLNFDQHIEKLQLHLKK